MKRLCVLLFLALLVSCKTPPPPTPEVVYNEQWVEYYSPPKSGFIGRTKEGHCLVTAGYVEWAEHRDIELKEALKKLEQERLSKLAAPK